MLINEQREKSLAPPPPRNQRLKFSPEVALLEATSRGDAEEGIVVFNLQVIIYLLYQYFTSKPFYGIYFVEEVSSILYILGPKNFWAHSLYTSIPFQS